MRTRFERRMADASWLRNDPNRVAGGLPFTESFFSTVAVLLAYADAERLIIETVTSPVPMTSTINRPAGGYSDLEDFDRTRAGDDRSEPRPFPGSLKAG